MTSAETPLLSFDVANDISVSISFETRVIEGLASLSEIACMAARPASQVGKR